MLSRLALQREVATLTAQLRAAETRLAFLQAAVDAHEAPSRNAHPATIGRVLADNVRLAHRAEQAEHAADIANARADLLEDEKAGHSRTLASFMDDWPQLFGDAGGAP